MARKTQISKEVILQTALQMLIEDGYSAINIKTLSQKIGCSTQPLVWHFENMDGLRKALAEYALNYANEKMTPKEDSAVMPFEQVGNAYIKMALYEPNLFKFVFLIFVVFETSFKRFRFSPISIISTSSYTDTIL